MPEVTLPLDDELFSKLQMAAALAGMDIESFLATKIHQHSAQLLRDVPKQWMPREQWDALVTGETCPICISLRAGEYIDEYGYTVADLQVSRLRLNSDQFTPGYCVLIAKTHVSEIYHLSQEDQRRYFEDMMWAARAIDRVFHPLKMNFEILGNALPHLHCHMKPRYYGDAAPSQPLYPEQEAHLLSAEAYENGVRLLREALDEMSR
ncbi:MAG: HIT family protein [Ktedonobacteraceae bacterium]|nr:HIT family protein [Ktedonobacteraceae bacterium]